MLFNNLKDFIYIEKIFSDELVLNSITEENTKFLDNIIKICIQTYKIKLENKDFKVIPCDDFYFNQYQIKSGPYKEIFEVKNNYYKYILCIIFLDNNSLIKIMNEIYHPKIGEIYLFPSAWFFTFEIIKKNNYENSYLINNIIHSYNKR